MDAPPLASTSPDRRDEFPTRRVRFSEAERPSLLQLLLAELPDDGEDGGLQCVGEEARAEAAHEEARPAVLVQNYLRRLLVSNGRLRGLPRRLEHADRVGDAIAHASGRYAQSGGPEQLQLQVIRWREGQRLVEGIECQVPRVLRGHPRSERNVAT